MAPRDALTVTGALLNRWGGNPNTRYNWAHGAAWNSGRDWFFANYGTDPGSPGAVADTFVESNRGAGVQTLLTLPAIGWLARDTNTATRSTGVPPHGGPPVELLSEAIPGYDPSANRSLTSVSSFARKPGPFSDTPDTTGGPVFQDEWVHHLVERFGPAASGGVAYYAIDNEPDLWSETHTDVHPVQPSYDDMLGTFLEYAQAVKDVDPGAQVLGPTVSGWSGYFYSARDRGDDNFRTHADRRAHADMPFLAWWLDQLRQHDESTGRRTLDLLDVHYYPQAKGVFAGATDDSTNRLRLRSTRSLWDPSYTDESWIGDNVSLIPRLRDWVDRYYPGTRLAITEWNWGADQTMNGALAIADVLGIFGREGVDLAAYWTSPPPDSPGALAFSMYTNYDGKGHRFGDRALVAFSDDPDDVGVYASTEMSTGDLIVIVVNRRSDVSLQSVLRVDGLVGSAGAQLYQYAASRLSAIEHLPALPVSDGQVAISLPTESISLIRFGH
ncbi:MAG: glycoside hydrolase family 44 protein [Chloroflexota bacterium]|nr:glycoside hydrolase family 44 protein [Chloroflexota bacterium]